MPKRYLLSILALVLIFAVGCGSQILPPMEEGAAEPTAGETAIETGAKATSTPVPVEAYPADVEAEVNQLPEAYPADSSSDVEESASETTAAEENLQLQPTNPTKDQQALKNIVLAKADLAERLGLSLPTTEIEVVAYEQVTWNDSSLGCPGPDMMYIQTLTDGYVIQLQVGDETYNYHGADGNTPFLCENEDTSGEETEVPVEEASLDPDAQRAINLAKNSLVTVFGADFNAIELISYEPATWNDSSLGCPQPGLGYADVISEGYKIQLQVCDMNFNFHGADGEDPFLCLNVPDSESVGEVPAEEAMFDTESRSRIDTATIDLVDRLGVKPGDVTLLSYEPVTWSDGSLGCPHPDMMYTQALVDGYQIQLQVGDQVYDYHGANGKDPFLCEE